MADGDEWPTNCVFFQTIISNTVTGIECDATRIYDNAHSYPKKPGNVIATFMHSLAWEEASVIHGTKWACAEFTPSTVTFIIGKLDRSATIVFSEYLTLPRFLPWWESDKGAPVTCVRCGYRTQFPPIVDRSRLPAWRQRRVGLAHRNVDTDTAFSTSLQTKSVCSSSYRPGTEKGAPVV